MGCISAMVSVDLKKTLMGIILSLALYLELIEYIAYQDGKEEFNLIIYHWFKLIIFYYFIAGLFDQMPWSQVFSIIVNLCKSPIYLIGEIAIYVVHICIGYVIVFGENETAKIVIYTVITIYFFVQTLRYFYKNRHCTRIIRNKYGLDSDLERKRYLRHVGLMRQINRVSFNPRNSGNINSVWMHEVPALTIGFWIYPHIFLLWLVHFVQRMLNLYVSSQVPLAIVLGQSGTSAHHIIERLQLATKPSTIVNALVDEAGIVNFKKNVSAWDSVRTRSPEQWQEVITILLEICHLVVIDESIDGDAVRFELESIRAKGLEEKCLFVVDNATNVESMRQRLNEEFGLRELYKILQTEKAIDQVREVNSALLRGTNKILVED